MSNHNNDDDFEITNEDLERLRFSCGFRSHAYNPDVFDSLQDYMNIENQRKERYIQERRIAHYTTINNNICRGGGHKQS